MDLTVAMLCVYAAIGYAVVVLSSAVDPWQDLVQAEAEKNLKRWAIDEAHDNLERYLWSFVPVSDAKPA